MHAPDKPECDDMVRNKLGKVFAGLLKAEDHDHELMKPMRRLHEVELLELGYHVPVRVAYVLGQVCT